MKKFSLFLILIHFSSSSLVNIPLNEIDPEVEYLKYLDNEEQKNYADFEEYFINRYEQHHLDCLKWLERHQYDFNANNTIFWMSLKITRQVFNPKFDLLKILKIVVKEIRDIIHYSGYRNESKFKKKFEVASLMIKTVERIYPILRSRGVNDILVNNMEDRIAIWKFLLFNISIDFNKASVDYDSLFRTFNEIRCIIRMNLPSEKASRISKLCSLLWYYLERIHIRECHVIFDSHHHYKPLIISLVRKVGCWRRDFFDKPGEFNSNRLRSFFKELYKDKGHWNHINLIMEILKNENPNYGKMFATKVHGKVFLGFFERTRIFNESFEKDNILLAWDNKAYAVLEFYLKINGLTISYPNIKEEE
jgi:hypothetical protein